MSAPSVTARADSLARAPEDQSEPAKQQLDRDDDLEYPQGGDTSDESVTSKAPQKGSVGSSSEGDSADPSSLNRDASKDERDDAPLDQKLSYNER